MLYEEYSRLELITPKMLRSTVLCDERTCLWFRKLFTQPVVIERVMASGEGALLYGRYKAWSFAAGALAVLSLALCVAGGVFFKSYFLLMGLGAVMAAMGAVHGLVKGREALAMLAVCLFEMDRPMIPSGTTLFQMGQIYARRYGVVSLVDVIWFWDQGLRDAFLFLFIMAFGVFFLPSWQTGLVLVGGCLLSACLIKLIVMWQRKI